MKLSFHGGAGEVTGACYLLESNESRVLVDCGLFQGGDDGRRQNSDAFPFDPKMVDALFVTHAHIDHVGRIPKLVHDGFSGTIYSTPPTKDLAMLLLADAMSLQEREGIELYSADDLKRAESLWDVLPYDSGQKINNIEVILREAGHILGSAMVEIFAEGKRILFSGDLGNAPSVLLPAPADVRNVDYLLIESTYGGKIHETDEARRLGLERAVEDISARGGTLMIPAFATERTQDLLFLMNGMLVEKRIPEIPVFVDSPLAIKVTQVFESFPSFYKKEIRDLYIKHPKLFRFKKLRLTESVEESKRINEIPSPKVVIAGSGMMNGGRILHHVRRYLQDHKSILLIVGYQAAGSLGRRLIDGEKLVRIFGEDIAVHAEIRKLSGFSAHADSPQLYAFVERMRETLKRVFIIQGEQPQSMHIRQDIRDRLGIPADIPVLGDEFEL